MDKTRNLSPHTEIISSATIVNVVNVEKRPYSDNGFEYRLYVRITNSIIRMIFEDIYAKVGLAAVD
jgi:hypothetical protein